MILRLTFSLRCCDVPWDHTATPPPMLTCWRALSVTTAHDCSAFAGDTTGRVIASVWMMVMMVWNFVAPD
uniref:Uncharacterized protein n=1 Tax=Anopheles christyi TaxID=43041 RepID=A0A182KIW4_9DIPT